MNWVFLLYVKKIDKNKALFKILFTDITLSSIFEKIEEIIDISSYNIELENKIITIFNNKVALKEKIYVIYNDKEEFDFLKTHMPIVSSRIYDEINLKSFFIISSNIIEKNFENLLKHW
jgi:hypothetical protein